MRPSLSLILLHIFPHSNTNLALSLSLSHTHTHTHSFLHSLSHTCAHTQTHTHKQTNINSIHTQTHYLSLLHILSLPQHLFHTHYRLLSYHVYTESFLNYKSTISWVSPSYWELSEPEYPAHPLPGSCLIHSRLAWFGHATSWSVDSSISMLITSQHLIYILYCLGCSCCRLLFLLLMWIFLVLSFLKNTYLHSDKKK